MQGGESHDVQRVWVTVKDIAHPVTHLLRNIVGDFLSQGAYGVIHVVASSQISSGSSIQPKTLYPASFVAAL